VKPHLRALNPEQRSAVEAIAGPVLVLAGAGSGKTRVITHRVAHLLHEGVAARAILALTFTNKAAGEMRERIADLVGKKQAEVLTVGTFHAFCLHTLRERGASLGWDGGFTLCDAGDQLAVHKAVLRELRVPEASLRPSDLAAAVSLAKNRLETPERLAARASDPRGELVSRAWRRYQETLRLSRRMDFDDLLTETVRLLTEDARALAFLRDRFRYLLVDEYQDTNGPQYEILRALAGERRNLCVVGDDDQSIYGWRGADVKKILAFEQHFPGAKVVRLETNYRSTEPILAIANRLIAHNPHRHAKVLRSALGPGDPPRAVCMRDEDTEAVEIVAEIQRHVQQGAHYDDFAILFRAATQARPFEAELRMKGVPYVLIGGLSFFDRKEVRDVMAYLRLVENPRDETSLLRILNCPPRGVGKTTQERALAFATEHGVPVAEAFHRAEEAGLAPAAAEAVTGLLGRLAALRGRYPKGAQLVELVQRLVEEVAYRDEVRRLYPDEAEFERRWAGVSEVLNFAENHVRRRKRPGLGTFLNELTLSATDARDEGDGERALAVTLMTLHASKGLEFPRVWLVGLEEGLLPHRRSVEEDSLEEERRLAYVGVTRARQQLTLTWCRERARAGHRVQCHPSRFLLEMQGKEPPSDWVPAGGESPPPSGRARRRRGSRRRRVPRGR